MRISLTAGLVLLLAAFVSRAEAQQYYVQTKLGILPAFDDPANVTPSYWKLLLYPRGFTADGSPTHWGVITGKTAASVQKQLEWSQRVERQFEKLVGHPDHFTSFNPFGPIAVFEEDPSKLKTAMEVLDKAEDIHGKIEKAFNLLTGQTQDDEGLGSLERKAGDTVTEYLEALANAENRVNEATKYVDDLYLLGTQDLLDNLTELERSVSKAQQGLEAFSTGDNLSATQRGESSDKARDGGHQKDLPPFMQGQSLESDSDKLTWTIDGRWPTFRFEADYWWTDTYNVVDSHTNCIIDLSKIGPADFRLKGADGVNLSADCRVRSVTSQPDFSHPPENITDNSVTLWFADSRTAERAITYLQSISDEPEIPVSELSPPPPELKPLTVDGQPYVGEVKNGKPSGQGTAVMTTEGGLWTGEYIEGAIAPDVEGTLQQPDGLTYQGAPPRDGERNEARIRWPDGTVYQGEVLGTKPDGSGELTKPDGRTTIVTYQGGAIVATRSPEDDEPAPPAPAKPVSTEICVPFDRGRNDLRQDAILAIDQAAAWKLDGYYVQIIGSADSDQDPALFAPQSLKRGEAVRDRLLQLGFKTEDLKIWIMDIPVPADRFLDCAVSMTRQEIESANP
jgi:hypothetical protein